MLSQGAAVINWRRILQYASDPRQDARVAIDLQPTAPVASVVTDGPRLSQSELLLRCAASTCAASTAGHPPVMTEAVRATAATRLAGRPSERAGCTGRTAHRMIVARSCRGRCAPRRI